MFKNIYFDWNEYLRLHRGSKLKILILFLPIFFHNPGMLFSVLYRIENYFLNSRILKIFGYILYPLYFLITYYILDIDISPSAKIGKGLYIHNRGIIISDKTCIGEYCKIMGPITIGVNINKIGSATLGDHVVICTGARIIGEIKIGDNCVIGANAVVVNDFRSNSVIAGVPAKIVKTNSI